MPKRKYAPEQTIVKLREGRFIHLLLLRGSRDRCHSVSVHLEVDHDQDTKKNRSGRREYLPKCQLSGHEARLHRRCSQLSPESHAAVRADEVVVATALASQRVTVFHEIPLILAMADLLTPSTLMAATSSKSLWEQRSR